MAASKRRSGLALPLILIAGGVLLLLGNLGVIDVPSWDTLVRFWPVLLIAIGADLIFGRSSLSGVFSALLMVAILLALGSVAFRFFAPADWQLRNEIVSISRDGAMRATIDLACDTCSLDLYATSAEEPLVGGRASIPRISTLRQSIATESDLRAVEIDSRTARWLPWQITDRHLATWDLGLSSAGEVSLTASAYGDVRADLVGLDIATADITSTHGDVRLNLSTRDGATYIVAGGDIAIAVPEGLNLSVQAAETSLSVGEGLTQSGTMISSVSSSGLDVAMLTVRSADTVTFTLAVQSESSLSD